MASPGPGGTTSVAMKSSMFFCVALGIAACSSSPGDPAPSGPAAAGTAPKTRANGTLGDWQPLGAMPVPRGNHCAVVANGWLVVIGGNYKPKGAKDFVTVADVHSARINADGTLGDWQLAGKTPSPVSSCTAAADGADVVLLDGIYDDEAAGKSIHASTIDDAGMLGAWRDAGALPDGVRVPYSQATVVDHQVRAFEAKLPGAGDAVALVRASLSGGSLSAWSDAPWLTGFRGHPQYVFAGSYVYALGGYAGPDRKNEVLSDGAGARLDETGAPGPSFAVTALPEPTAFGRAVAVDDWVFVTGGKDQVMSGTPRADVVAAHIAEDGTLGAWSSVAPLPQGRTAHAAIAAGDFLYVLGGAFDAGGVDSVFVARVRFEAP